MCESGEVLSSTCYEGNILVLECVVLLVLECVVLLVLECEVLLVLECLCVLTFDAALCFSSGCF